MIFRSKKLGTPPRFCMRLKEARVRRGISLEDMSRRTRVNVQYLKALEECRLHELPGGAVYTRQYIRLYAQAVGIDERTIVKSFGFEHEWEKTKNKSEEKLTPRTLAKKSFFNIPKFIRGVALFGAGGALVTLVAFQMVRFLEPPALAINNPPDGLVTQAENITIEGSTEKEALVHINGTPIVKSEEGLFSESIPLQKGLNTFSIQATKKSGKQTILIRTIVRETPEDKLTFVH